MCIFHCLFFFLPPIDWSQVVINCFHNLLSILILTINIYINEYYLIVKDINYLLFPKQLSLRTKNIITIYIKRLNYVIQVLQVKKSFKVLAQTNIQIHPLTFVQVEPPCCSINISHCVNICLPQIVNPNHILLSHYRWEVLWGLTFVGFESVWEAMFRRNHYADLELLLALFSPVTLLRFHCVHLWQ